jgi:hypothetical protein
VVSCGAWLPVRRNPPPQGRRRGHPRLAGPLARHFRSRLQTTPASLAESEIAPNEFRLPDVNDHHGNSLECIRNIAMKLGRKLRWEPKAEQFVDDLEANRMLSRPMRSPYTLKEMA